MIYRFGPFELDTASGELRADGERRPLEPQVYAVLALLLENRERLVTMDELIEKVWDGRDVSDAVVSSRIRSVRRALGDDGRTQRYIATLPRRGFRFAAEVNVERPMFRAARPLHIAERPSLAVLPFVALGTTAPAVAIADALPHDLITELARLRWLFVTARGSSFRFRGAEADPVEVARQLGVRYCLLGTVAAVRGRLTVTVELVDARDGRVIWADRFSGPLADVHALRAEILARVLVAFEIRVPEHEANLARLSVSESLDAWSAYHLGLQHMYRFNRKDNAAAAAYFGKAVELDADFARAHAGLSFVHFQTAFLRHSGDVAGERERARRHAARALELDALDPFVNFAMGRTFWLEGDLDSSLGWLERATAISPNFAQGVYARAWTETLAGNFREGRAHVDLAMQLSPLDPLFYAMLATRALTHLFEQDDVEASVWARRAARSPGAHVLIAMIAAVSHALAGDVEQAQFWAANVRARDPALRLSDFLRAFPIRDGTERARVAAALEALGF